MNSNDIWKTVIILIALGTGGCAGKNISVSRTAFEGMPSTQLAKTSLLRYQSVLSPNGIMPSKTVGMFFDDPNTKKIFGKTLSPSLSIGISPKTSFLVEQDFNTRGFDNANVDSGCTSISNAQQPSNIGQQVVLQIRQAYLKARTDAVKVAALNVRVQAANMAMNILNEGKDTPQYLLDILGLDSSDKDKVQGKVQGKVQEYTGKLQIAQEVLSGSTRTLVCTTGVANVLVARWTEAEAKGGRASGMGQSVSGTSKSSHSGIMILANFRTLSLNIGEDYVNMIRQFGKDDWRRKLFSEIGLVTYAVQAKNMASIEELDSEKTLAIALHISKETLAAMKGNPSVNIDANLAASANLFNSVVINAPRMSTRPIYFDLPFYHQKFIQGELKSSDDGHGGYVTVFEVRAALKEKLIRSFPVLPDTYIRIMQRIQMIASQNYGVLGADTVRQFVVQKIYDEVNAKTHKALFTESQLEDALLALKLAIKDKNNLVTMDQFRNNTKHKANVDQIISTLFRTSK